MASITNGSQLFSRGVIRRRRDPFIILSDIGDIIIPLCSKPNWTKSPLSSRINSGSFSNSQESLETHQISSGISDVSSNDCDVTSAGRRFVNLDANTINSTPPEERRLVTYQQLRQDAETTYRLSKSHVDLTEIRRVARSSITSAPPVKPLPTYRQPAEEIEELSTGDKLKITEIPKKPEINDVINTTHVSEPVLERKDTIPKMPHLPPKRQLSRKTSTQSMRSLGAVNTSGTQTQNSSATFSDSLEPFAKVREGLQETLTQLESPDWESSVRGLRGLVRLVRHHRDVVEANVHALCVLLGKHIRNLRSQVARAACAAAAEMLETQRRAAESELEELAAPLLARTADTNRFLRQDAHTALDAMCRHCSAAKVVAVLSVKGVRHHNAVVRCTAARLLNGLVKRVGREKFYSLPKEARDKTLRAGADLLTEGSLETRRHAKEMFGQLGPDAHLQRALIEAVPAATLRHIGKIISNLK